MEENGIRVWTTGWFTKFGISEQSADKYAAAFSRAEMIEMVLEEHAKAGETAFHQYLLKHQLDLTSFDQDAIRLGLLERSKSGSPHISGTVYTWGSNKWKMLGYDTPKHKTSVPKMIPQLTKIIQVAPGSSHCLALSEDGDVMSWGMGSKGQLGMGNIQECTLPVKIAMPDRIMHIAAGDEFSLAMSGDHVYSWGDNGSGQAGMGIDAPQVISVPGQIEGLKPGIKICAGYHHALLLTREGHVYAWGHNLYGQLGLGDTTNRLEPVQLSCEVAFADICVGSYHNLGLNSMDWMG
eukprot:TRINITY_DN2102_c1_g1_i11.p1 TRINITY_DN2102_c1_g1~~TRINITY_DN2102_c1_g1_i11.p1  ORF type:complete len:294 (-),score=65.12 TRINITY_DN2102_c1_g1_i11:386-1267(-)